MFLNYVLTITRTRALKEIIIKDKLESNEDPDDFYLKHNGGGQFEIRRKVDLSTVIGTDNNPLIFYRKDLLEIKQNRIKDYKSEIKKMQTGNQEIKKEFSDTIFNIEGA